MFIVSLWLKMLTEVTLVLPKNNNKNININNNNNNNNLYNLLFTVIENCLYYTTLFLLEYIQLYYYAIYYLQYLKVILVLAFLYSSQHWMIFNIFIKVVLKPKQYLFLS